MREQHQQQYNIYVFDYCSSLLLDELNLKYQDQQLKFHDAKKKPKISLEDLRAAIIIFNPSQPFENQLTKFSSKIKTQPDHRFYFYIPDNDANFNKLPDWDETFRGWRGSINNICVTRLPKIDAVRKMIYASNWENIAKREPRTGNTNIVPVPFGNHNGNHHVDHHRNKKKKDRQHLAQVSQQENNSSSFGCVFGGELTTNQKIGMVCAVAGIIAAGLLIAGATKGIGIPIYAALVLHYAPTLPWLAPVANAVTGFLGTLLVGLGGIGALTAARSLKPAATNLTFGCLRTFCPDPNEPENDWIKAKNFIDR